MITVIENKHRPHLLMYNAVDDTYQTNIIPCDEFTLRIDKWLDEEIEIFNWLCKDMVHNYNTAIESLERFISCKDFFYSLTKDSNLPNKEKNPEDYKEIITNLKKQMLKAKRKFQINQL